MQGALDNIDKVLPVGKISGRQAGLIKTTALKSKHTVTYDELFQSHERLFYRVGI